MEQENMDDGGCKSCKTWSDGERKKWTQVELSIALIRSYIEIKVGRQYLGSIILLPFGSEELIREDGKLPGIKGVEFPVTQGYYNVDEHDETNCCVQNGEPWSDQRAAMIRRDPCPVQREGTDTKAVVSWPNLLSSYTARPWPADPREEGQYGQEIARQCVVCEACNEEQQEELHPG